MKKRQEKAIRIVDEFELVPTERIKTILKRDLGYTDEDINGIDLNNKAIQIIALFVENIKEFYPNSIQIRDFKQPNVLKVIANSQYGIYSLGMYITKREHFEYLHRAIPESSTQIEPLVLNLFFNNLDEMLPARVETFKSLKALCPSMKDDVIRTFAMYATPENQSKMIELAELINNFKGTTLFNVEIFNFDEQPSVKFLEEKIDLLKQLKGKIDSWNVAREIITCKNKELCEAKIDLFDFIKKNNIEVKAEDAGKVDSGFDIEFDKKTNQFIQNPKAQKDENIVIMAAIRDLREEHMTIIDKIQKIYKEFGISEDSIEFINSLAFENKSSVQNAFNYIKLLTDLKVPQKKILGYVRRIQDYNKNLIKMLAQDTTLSYEMKIDIIEHSSPSTVNRIEKLYVEKDFPNDKIIEFAKLLEKEDLSKLDLDIKMEVLDNLSALDEETKTLYKKYGYDADKIMGEISALLGKKRNLVSLTKEQQMKFLKNVLSNNNPNAERILKTFDFAKYGKDGLPLKYPRHEYCTNIYKLLSELSADEASVLMSHFGLKRGEMVETSTGIKYTEIEGLLNNKPFPDEGISAKVKEIAAKIQEEIEKFTKFNEVNTGDAKVNEILNGLIQGFPEFASITGKIQHDTHAYSVDIHTLKVLQSAMNDPIYKTLSDSDKTILKISAIIHDLGKKAGVVDKGHQSLSADYANSVLDRYNLPRRIRDRILDIVENHHWFEQYNNKKITPEDVAIRCRRPEDFKIYQILAKADYSNVNDDFHLDRVKNGIDGEGLMTQEEFDKFMADSYKPIEDALRQMYMRANPVFDTQFVRNGELFPRVKVKINDIERELKILDLNKLADDESLQPFGFAPGVTKESARFTVTVQETAKSQMETTFFLTSNSLMQSVWSTSLIQPKNNRTFNYKGFGFILDTDISNISEAYCGNTSSGRHKTIEKFRNLMFNKIYKDDYHGTDMFEEGLQRLQIAGIKLSKKEQAELRFKIFDKFLTNITDDIKVGNHTFTPKDLEKYFGRPSRLFVRDNLLRHLDNKGYNLSDDEYTQLAKYLITKKYTTQINKDLKIGNKIIKAADLIEALEKARDSLFENTYSHSEIVPINTRIKGLLAKVEKIEECPQELLDFAYSHNLPIILMKPTDKNCGLY